MNPRRPLTRQLRPGSTPVTAKPCGACVGPAGTRPCGYVGVRRESLFVSFLTNLRRVSDEMTITRSAVAQHLLEYADTASGHGIKVIYKDGKEVSEEAVTQTYRDVKRCAFCGKRSASMGAMAVDIPQYYARVVGGLKEGHMRLMYYGFCAGPETRAREEPDF